MIIVRIGRHEYEITGQDQFMDNGSCVQLLTQSKETPNWGYRPSPTLSKRAIKEIDRFAKKIHKHEFGERGKVFSLIGL
jgi:hypothetical protein